MFNIQIKMSDRIIVYKRNAVRSYSGNYPHQGLNWSQLENTLPKPPTIVIKGITAMFQSQLYPRLE
jgi:hypothetical protein